MQDSSEQYRARWRGRFGDDQFDVHEGIPLGLLSARTWVSYTEKRERLAPYLEEI